MLDDGSWRQQKNKKTCQQLQIYIYTKKQEKTPKEHRKPSVFLAKQRPNVCTKTVPRDSNSRATEVTEDDGS
jgi:hypothetical protein